MAGICSNREFSFLSDVLCEIRQQIDRIYDEALRAKDQAEDEVERLGNILESGRGAVVPLDNALYDPSTEGVPKDFTAPAEAVEPDYSGEAPSDSLYPATEPLDVPVAPEIPGTTGGLLSSETYEDIFEQAAARVARVNVTELDEATYLAASRGFGLPTAAMQTAARRVTSEAAKRLQELALTQTAKEAEIAAQDQRALLNTRVQSYEAQWGGVATQLKGIDSRWDGFRALYDTETNRLSARISNYRALLEKEGEKRGWSQMQINEELSVASTALNGALEQAKLILDRSIESQKAVASLNVSLFSALMTAVEYSLSGVGQVAASESN